MIRLATLDDVPAIVEIGRVLHAESPRFSRLPYVEERAAGFIAHLISIADGWVAVAEAGGRIVGGMAGLAYQEWFSTEKIATDVSLFVLPEHRGTFLGARLIKAFRAWAEQSGARYAVAGMSTGIATEQTTQMYECLGAQRVGPIVEFTWS